MADFGNSGALNLNSTEVVLCPPRAEDARAFPIACRRPGYSGRLRAGTALKESAMKPEHEPRRVIIREWMSLPREKRSTPEQASAFSTKAATTHTFECSGDRLQRIRGWLEPRIGRK